MKEGGREGMRVKGERHQNAGTGRKLLLQNKPRSRISVALPHILSIPPYAMPYVDSTNYPPVRKTHKSDICCAYRGVALMSTPCTR